MNPTVQAPAQQGPAVGQQAPADQARRPTTARTPRVAQATLSPAGQAASTRLQSANVASSPNEAAEIIIKTKRRMNKAASKTAAIQGTATYGRSFGAFGVGSRAVGQGITEAKSPIASAIVNTVTSATLPLAHSKAAAASAPGPGATKFVKTDDAQQLRPNFTGNAFRPFIAGLSAGNLAVSGLSLGAAALGAPKAANTAITNLALTVPGALSAVHTVRNVFAEQAAAGFSLQEPLMNQSGDVAGSIVTHQQPIAKNDGTDELGKITVNGGGQKHEVSIRANDANNISVVIESAAQDAPSADTRGPLTKVGQGIVNFAKDTGESIVNAFTNSKDAVKVGSLVSSVAVAQGFSNYAAPVINSTLQAKGMSETNAALTTAAINTVVTNLLLSFDFIPKFMTHGTGTETNADGARKIGAALIPVVGGAAAFATGNADLNTPRLSEDTFGDLAANKAAMLAGLAQMGLGVVQDRETGITVNAEALQQFVTNRTAADSASV